ncbi:MAG: hypothetical protein HOQ27_10345 [Dermatophilaceae bacterium]|nr:hypothetical protein [Dermatophilaceae bacterium]
MADEFAPVKARVEAALGTSRTVYGDRAPDDASGAYVVVSTSTGVSGSTNLAAGIDRRSPVIFVTSVATAPATSDVSEEQLAGEVRWAMRKVVDALAGWTPSIGRATFAVEHVVSERPVRDRDVPGLRVMAATDQFIAQYQP